MSEIKSHQSVTSTTIHFVSKVFLLESGEYFHFFSSSQKYHCFTYYYTGDRMIYMEFQCNFEARPVWFERSIECVRCQKQLGLKTMDSFGKISVYKYNNKTDLRVLMFQHKIIQISKTGRSVRSKSGVLCRRQRSSQFYEYFDLFSFKNIKSFDTDFRNNKGNYHSPG